MKKLILLALFLFPYYLFAQTLNGRVYRQDTDSAIVNASVYYSGSTTGTVTNSKGEFILQAKSGQVPLVISCVGYQTAEVKNYHPGQDIKVFLKPKQFELQGVTVTSDGMSREEKVRIFTREFIGTSKYAKSCTITNIDDVDLFYDRKNKTLTAESSKPIIINNQLLGYHITYYLDHFKRTPTNIAFAGNYIFKDVATADDQKKINNNRGDAYEGSRMQFIRALWHRSIKSSGFKIYRSNYTRLTEDSIIARDSAREQYLYLAKRVIVEQRFNGGMLTYTSLIPVTKFSYIDKDGFYGAGIRWAGRLGYQRIGDLLPFEYQPPENEVKKQQDNDMLVNAVFDDERVANAVGSITIAGDKELKRFKDIVLGKGYLPNDLQFVRKWQQPIYYKVYGSMNDSTSNNSLQHNINSFFKNIADVTGLTIEQKQVDSLVNFAIILGNVKKYYAVINEDAREYFNSHKNGTGYSNYSPDGYSRTAQKIAVDGFTLQLTWLHARSQILNGLGFIGKVNIPRSIFYDGMNYWTPNKPFEQFDTDVIKTLYNSKIITGMQDADLDAVLKPGQISVKAN